jgi:hypothetical protein
MLIILTPLQSYAHEGEDEEIIVLSKFVDGDIAQEVDPDLEQWEQSYQVEIESAWEKDLINFAIQAGSEEPKEFILFKWKTLNADNVVEFLKIYFEHCGYGTYDMERSDGNTAISVHHNLGEKGSLYLKSFVESVIQSTIEQPCESTITKDSLTIIFRA